MFANVIALSLVRDMKQSFEVYTNVLQMEIDRWIRCKIDLAVLPEYCWRLSNVDQVLCFINEIKDKIAHMLVVFGTIEIATGDHFTNSAIIVHNGCLTLIPKYKVLASEVARNVLSGQNTGIVMWGNVRVGLAICADLWDDSLMKYLAIDQRTDIIIVPAWTCTSNRAIAKRIFCSLALTRSNQYMVPIIVADHVLDHATTQVGNCTAIYDPSKRDIVTNCDDVYECHGMIDFDRVRESKKRWYDKGLGPNMSTHHEAYDSDSDGSIDF